MLLTASEKDNRALLKMSIRALLFDSHANAFPRTTSPNQDSKTAAVPQQCSDRRCNNAHVTPASNAQLAPWHKSGMVYVVFVVLCVLCATCQVVVQVVAAHTENCLYHATGSLSGGGGGQATVCGHRRARSAKKTSLSTTFAGPLPAASGASGVSGSAPAALGLAFGSGSFGPRLGQRPCSSCSSLMCAATTNSLNELEQDCTYRIFLTGDSSSLSRNLLIVLTHSSATALMRSNDTSRGGKGNGNRIGDDMQQKQLGCDEGRTHTTLS